MNTFIETEGYKNKVTYPEIQEMINNSKPRFKKIPQREIDFFHQFKDEWVNTELKLNGHYHVLVIFTPEDTWFTINSITIQDTALAYPVEFEQNSWQPNNVYDHAINYLNEHPEEYML